MFLKSKRTSNDASGTMAKRYNGARACFICVMFSLVGLVLVSSHSLSKVVAHRRLAEVKPVTEPTTGSQIEEQPVAALDSSSIAVAVVTFDGRQKRSIPAIRNTWGSAFQNIEYVSATAEEGLITMVVKGNEAYARSSWEEMWALKMLYEKYPNSSWYMKTDDDAYINTGLLLKAMESFDASVDHYVGIPLVYSKDGKRVQYCAGGVGYLISNSAMKQLHPRLLEPLRSCCSDVQLGELLTETMNKTDPCSIIPGRFMADHLARWIEKGEKGRLTAFEEPAEKVIAEQVIGFHYVTPDMMYLLKMLSDMALRTASATTSTS